MISKINEKQIMMMALCVTALVIAAFTFGRYTQADKPTQQAQASTPAQTDASSVMVGVLRADGTLVPFAQYTNETWWNPWPQPITDSVGNPQTTKSLGDHEKPWFKQNGRTPTTWYFWSSARAPTVLKASEIVRAEVHSEVWALLTDFPNAEQLSKGSHYENLGVSLTVDQKVNRMIELDQSSTEAKHIFEFIKLDFEQAEANEIDRLRGKSAARSDEKAMRRLESIAEMRGEVEVSITQLFRSEQSVNGQHIYYFEARKQYKQPATSKDVNCDDIFIYQGWMTQNSDRSGSNFEEQIVLTDCDGKGSKSVSPFGIVTLENRTFLFVGEHGYEDESYAIFEFDKSGLHRMLETIGGGL